MLIECLWGGMMVLAMMCGPGTPTPAPEDKAND